MYKIAIKLTLNQTLHDQKTYHVKFLRKFTFIFVSDQLKEVQMSAGTKWRHNQQLAEGNSNTIQTISTV